jgi:hypothetical protein
MILAFIMLQFTILCDLKMGKKLYVIVEENETKQFETIHSHYESSFYPYKILPRVYLYSIDEDNYLSLFKLNRNTTSINLEEAYTRNWEYYASYSPVWYDRIKKCKGVLNKEKKTIEFPDDDCFEEFYDAFNYETDEQKITTQNKSIQEILKKRTWVEFYEQHNKNGLFVPAMEVLENLGTIYY